MSNEYDENLPNEEKIAQAKQWLISMGEYDDCSGELYDIIIHLMEGKEDETYLYIYENSMWNY